MDHYVAADLQVGPAHLKVRGYYVLPQKPRAQSPIAHRRAPKARYPAGCCCVRQWMAPSPQMSARQSTPTIFRFFTTPRRMRSASASR